MENIGSKIAPQRGRMFTKDDYVNTREAIEYCKEKLPIVRKKIPYQFAKQIREILLKNGFDYPLKYIRDCIKQSRTIYNIHIVQAAERLAEATEDPCIKGIHWDPDNDTLPKRRRKKSILESQGLFKLNIK